VDTYYCYSPRGETTDVYQSTPNSAGYAHLIMNYWANGQIDTIGGIRQLSSLYYTVDGEGRHNGFDPTALSPDPIKTVSYNPASEIANVNFASGETDAYSYDAMGRVNNYTYVLGSNSLVGQPTWNPNGTLGKLNITDQFNSTNNQNCTYTHDDLARISNASCTAWAQAFTYDQFGNNTKSGSSSWMPGYNSSNNQYSSVGATYDSNGNLTYDTFNHYTWDADANIATVNVTTTNTYDAFDKLVETSAGPTQFLYLPGGTQPFATMSNYQNYLRVFAPAPGGTMVITPNGHNGVISYHRHTDWIGSSRFASTPAETVYFDGGYAPFGEPYATSGTPDYVFAENAQDASVVEGATAGYAYDTLNRKYSAAQSRWIAPDPAGLNAVDLTNPQSWNRYAYVLNTPLNYFDPFGLTNDCGGPCTPLTYIIGNCQMDITYHEDAGGYDIPSFEVSCGTGGGRGQPMQATPDQTPENQKNPQNQTPQTKQQKCAAAKANLAALESQGHAMAHSLLKEAGAGVGVGCVAGIVTGEALESPLIGTPAALGNCAVGAIGTGTTTVGIFYIANAGDIVSGVVSEAEAVEQIIENCF
jgi:RHS repeat-associated protein